MAALKYWVWLTTLPGLGERAKLQLLAHFGSPEEIYFAPEGELLLAEGITKLQAALLADKSLDRAEKVLEDCARDGQFLLTMDDAGYPARLRNIYDPPLLLYGKGSLPLFDDEVAVTVVGTRDCTPYGVRAASQLGYELARQGALLVSGMAKGIDGEALKGALRAGGFTAAVLGGGADVVYPAANRRLYEDIAATGVILSEYPPGTEPRGDHFPVRNRLLSALSLATVVVEAPEKSGALITAATALEQGREVFAVPGPFDAPKSRGCNTLIRECVCFFFDAWDVLSFYESRFPHKLRSLRATIPPLPKGLFAPKLENSAEELERLVYEKAHRLYGDELPKIVQDRIDLELPGIIQRFREECPDVDVDIRMADHVDVPYELLAQGKMDAILVSPQDEGQYEWVHLADDPMFAVLPKDFDTQGMTAFPLAAFEARDFIMPSQGFDKDIMRIFNRIGVKPHILPTWVDDPTVISMVSHGLGVSMMTELTVRGRTDGVKLLPVEPASSRELGLAVRLFYASSDFFCHFIDCTKRVVAEMQP